MTGRVHPRATVSMGQASVPHTTPATDTCSYLQTSAGPGGPQGRDSGPVQGRAGSRSRAVPAAVLVSRAVLTVAPRDSWKVLGDLGQGEQDVALHRALSSELCLNLQHRENLAGTSWPFSSGHAVEWALSLLAPGKGEEKGGWRCIAWPWHQLWLSARDCCRERISPPENPLHCWETPTFPFSCICV